MWVARAGEVCVWGQLGRAGNRGREKAPKLPTQDSKMNQSKARMWDREAALKMSGFQAVLPTAEDDSSRTGTWKTKAD